MGTLKYSNVFDLILGFYQTRLSFDVPNMPLDTQEMRLEMLNNFCKHYHKRPIARYVTLQNYNFIIHNIINMQEVFTVLWN